MQKLVKGGEASNRLREQTDGRNSRARILEAAGQLFAARGFDGVSTRELAAAAKVNISAITYYFQGKNGLYRSVLEQLVDDTAPLFDPMISRMEHDVADAGARREALAETAVWFVGALLSGILTDPKIRWQMPLVMREFQQPSSGFQFLYTKRIEPMHNVIAKLVSAALQINPKATETKIVTATIIGQCMAFGFARAVIFARTGWQDYDEHNRQQVIEIVSSGILRSLNLSSVHETAKC